MNRDNLLKNHFGVSMGHSVIDLFLNFKCQLFLHFSYALSMVIIYFVHRVEVKPDSNSVLSSNCPCVGRDKHPVPCTLTPRCCPRNLRESAYPTAGSIRFYATMPRIALYVFMSVTNVSYGKGLRRELNHIRPLLVALCVRNPHSPMSQGHITYYYLVTADKL